MTTKGYKVFNEDWKCRGFQYIVGKTYTHKENMELCGAGFHFCEKLSDCFNYYSFDPKNKVAEIEAKGEIITDGDKSVTNKIKIIRELTWYEVLNMLNSGESNTGRGNTGSWNSGYGNSGNWNSGYRNSGNRNTGMFNSCTYSNGLFNSISPKIYMFNEPTKLTYEEFREKYSEAYSLLRYSDFYLTEWISESNMTDKEKEENPNYKTIGGYLKVRNYKEACRIMWDSFSKKEKELVKNLPNFNKEVFSEITGIEV